MGELTRIEKQILLRAPRSRVFRALTDHREFSAWFGHEMLEPFAVGAVIRARSEWEGRVSIEPFLIVEAIEPEHRFAFRWVPDELDPALAYEQQPMTLVELRLEEVDGGTLLTQTESGYDRIPQGKREWLFRNDRGWTEQMRNLERYMEGHLDELSNRVLTVSVNDRINAPLPRVHDAIVDPEKMRHYFISRGDARMTSGAKVEWAWEDVGAKLTADVIEVTPARIVFEWTATGPRTRVTITLDADGDATKLLITEASFRMMTDGVKGALQQTQGWTDFLCSLKAYLVHGVNLRTGRAVPR
jgi:uncharacterized protein YndB with AHSA1/START domain